MDTVKVVGNRLYVAGDGLAAYDITNRRKPRWLGRLSALFSCHGMAAKGDFVVFGTSSALDGTFMVDAADPSFMLKIGNSRTPGYIEAADWKEDLIFLANGNGNSWQIVQWNRATNAPVTILPPRNALVAAGSEAKLSASASGGERLMWQWYKEGVLLQNQTNRVLAIPNASTNDAGQYSAVVTSSVGPTTVGSGRLAFAPRLKFEATFLTGPPAFVTTQLPEDLQATLQASPDLLTWDTLWSGQAPAAPIQIQDRSDQPKRFYRLRFGLE